MNTNPLPDEVTATPAQQLGDYLRSLRRRWKLIVGITALVTAAALAVSLTSTKQYDATAKLLLSRTDQAVSDLLRGTSSSTDDPEREINTAVALIEEVAPQVKQRLNLKTSVPDLLEQVSTEVEGTSDIVNVTVRDTEPRQAAAIANAFIDAYVQFRRTSARGQIEEAARQAQAELNTLVPDDRAGERGSRLEGRVQELQSAAALLTGNVEVVRRASAPTDPSRPRPLLSAVLGLILGLGLGVLGALVLELIDRRIKEEEDVAQEYELPVLTSIPRQPRRGRAAGDDRGQREAYGMLGANLRLSSALAESRVLLVTSAVPAEGKTTVSLGLTRALALLGQRVITIEADLRRPAFARYLNLDRDLGGLASVLAGSSEVSEELIWLDAASLQPVTMDGLKEGLSFALLPVGSAPLNPQRALARPAMGAIIEHARSLADVVIIDTAPIGTVNDAATLVDHVDAALVVSRLDHTTRDAARRTRRLLRNLGVPLPGVVVTNGHSDSDGYYYGDPEGGERPAVIDMPAR